ncbi:MAG: AAA family ATPase [Candidatus Syntropharchaeia archaeon]
MTYVREIILENFMSYEYGRIPLKKGLNIICGPNGAGKSSILIALSVALGQVHTERGKKLGDLVRHGEEMGRVSLVFDNTPVNGKRPIRFCKSDTFMLSRYLRKDGFYWYEADYRGRSKYEITEILRELGINPDNMLIIMHQHMVDRFSVTTPSEKLLSVEEAIGFKKLRERIIGAKNELSDIINEESALMRVLQSTESTLSYWKGLYEKYQKKKELIKKREELEQELVSAQIIRWEKIYQSHAEKLEGKQRVLERILRKSREEGEKIKKLKDEVANKQFEGKRLFYELLRLEKEKTRKELLEEEIDDLNKEIFKIRARIQENDEEMEKSLEDYIERRINLGILHYRKKEIEREIREAERYMNEVKIKLESFPEIEKIDTQRSIGEISGEIKFVNAQIGTLSDVPDDTEEMYESYTEMLSELKEKLRIVEKNKEKAMKEVEERKKIWRRELEKFIDEINVSYNEILSRVNGRGRVRLINPDDIENAGLELSVGFRGRNPIVLDAYSLSGGERSVSVISFLLCLQKRIVSPVRAVDEFEVHMDPKNREEIFKALLSSVEDQQYILITPNPILTMEKDVNIILVQNIRGKSRIRHEKGV